MPELQIAAIGFGVSQVLLGLLLLAGQANWGMRKSLFGLLLLAILGYLLMPLGEGSGWAPLLGSVQTLVPGLFWLFSASVFNDQFRLRAWQVGLVAATVLPPSIGQLALSAESAWRWLFFGLPQALEFLLLGMTLWVVSRHWRTDLVESRRKLRLWFVGINGSYLFILILSREILFRGADWLSTWEYVAAAGMLLGFNLALLQYRPGSFFARESAPAKVADSPAPVESALVAQLEDYLDEGRPWQEMGLTIGQLAAQLQVPQYRLRAAINAGMGYRNFSDFLNSYRIREATGRLADPAERQLPVLTIAMDAGFRSLSSFNKAFKDMHGVTPTAWRKQSVHNEA
jgi:AraC-like DNA-binding protein